MKQNWIALITITLLSLKDAQLSDVIKLVSPESNYVLSSGVKDLNVTFEGQGEPDDLIRKLAYQNGLTVTFYNGQYYIYRKTNYYG